jgi:hypothetical protein
MAKPGEPMPWFKVTILHGGEKLIAYDISAMDAGDAKDEAWRRYEFVNGRESGAWPRTATWTGRTPKRSARLTGRGISSLPKRSRAHPIARSFS